MRTPPSSPVTRDPVQMPSSPSPGAIAMGSSVSVNRSAPFAWPQWQLGAQTVLPGTYW
nr:hypothetical protein [Naasia aerilata]